MINLPSSLPFIKKQLALLVLLALPVAAAYAQGTVNFSTRVSGTIIAHIYNADPINDNVSSYGNTAAEFPPGTQTYGGLPLQGTGYSAALWAANGAGATQEQLVMVPGSLTSFRTGGTLGGTPAPLALVVPNVPAGGTGTFQIRAWNNGGNFGAPMEQAAGFVGFSQLFTVSNLGDGVLTLPADMANFRSFSLYYVPEPGTYALLRLGGLAWLAFRRILPRRK